VAAARLAFTREQILAHRRRVGALDERLPPGPESLRRAAWAGLTDSMPRAALLSIHARVAGTEPDTWEDASLVQLWGPRFSAYVVAERDRAIFTLGRLTDEAAGLRRAVEMADRLEAYLDGRRESYESAGRALGINPNALRYGAPTGRILIRWEGARGPLAWTVPAPDMDPLDARLELARRYVHVLGPGTATGFGAWAGIRSPRAIATFEALEGELTAARTPIGDGWILASDEGSFRAPGMPAAPARLLPSGDAYYLLQGLERELVVPDPARRGELWTSRVWPGALLVGGEIAGTWRRDQANVSIQPWHPLSRRERDTVEEEAVSLPLPGLRGAIRVSWSP
jgi:hypothetical protein